MTIDKRKVLIAAVPLAIGLATLLFLTRIGHRPEPAREAPASAPQNPAHERAALEEELKRKPDHAPILLRLAELEREAGRTAGAVPYLRKVLEQDSKNEEARLELGRALYETGDVDGAIRETKQLLADHPNQVDGLYNLGAIYANLNRADLAREFWSKAVAAAPQTDSGRRAKDSLAQLAK
jgi:tetratricopeptide (TPR) repeat protein